MNARQKHRPDKVPGTSETASQHSDPIHGHSHNR